MPNGINSISPDIRDFLLSKNLILSDTITNNGLSSLGIGLGQPANISSIPTFVVPSPDIEVDGELYRDLNLINNPYAPMEDDVAGMVTVPFSGNLPIGTTQTQYPDFIGSKTKDSKFYASSDLGREQMLNNQYQPNDNQQEIVDINYVPKNYGGNGGGYVDNNNNLNLGGGSTTALDYIGGVLNGNSVGMDGKPSFDIRSSLAGRVLGATGVINDTPLGTISGQQLLIALGNKTLFNAQRETLGKINLNPISLLSGDSFFVPDYSITVAKTTGGKILDVGLNILGFEAPTSYLFKRESSIFAMENFVDTKSRLDSQVENTGKGQLISLFANLNLNQYRIGITDKVNPNLYMFGNKDGGMNDNTHSTDDVRGVISNSNLDLSATLRENGFSSLKGLEIAEEVLGDGPSSFVWSDDNDNFIANNGNYRFDKKTLLGKTQKLFETGRMKVMVNAQGQTVDGTSEIETSVRVGATNYLSRGSGVLSKEAVDGNSSMFASDVFCRTWTSLDKYNQVQDLQKHSGLGENFGLRNRNTTKLSVLDDNGFVRISPYIGDDGEVSGSQVPVNIKNFMFSLENLAWDGSDYANLPASEKGPGDLYTGTKGRIMWFPPYDLKFSESTSVNWDSHAFIGRGEPLYTYNNSERGGTLSFKVIIDHASYMNDMAGDANATNEMFASIAAGCYDFDLTKLKNMTRNEQNIIDVNNSVQQEEIIDAGQTAPAPFSIYFANDVATVFKPLGYETTGTSSEGVPGMIQTVSEGYTFAVGHISDDRLNYGLNSKFADNVFTEELKAKLKNECPACRITIKGYASTDGTKKGNSKLVDARANGIKKWFQENILEKDDPILEKRFAKVEGIGVDGCLNSSTVEYPVDAICKKEGRRVDIEFIYDPTLNELNKEAEAKLNGTSVTGKDLSDKIKSRFFNESLYFKKLEQEDKFVYDKLSEKIKHFHPAFHSITPEGFNARLNFLQQCTRQGPTHAGDGPDNLVFGMAPVLILRIGDFYHTKIVIENLDLDFDTGTGVQWDLNPEGVGVQPMIANVTINFKFLGGHSLNGPINKLQNAVSFNFFANTEVYDPRADYIKVETGKDGEKKGTYVNDLVKISADGKSETIGLGQVIGKGREASYNQENVAIVANQQQVTPAVVGPVINGFKYIEITGWSDNENAYSVYVSLDQQGIYNLVNNTSTQILTIEEMKTFINKGIKLTLESSTTPDRVEEVISGSASTPSSKTYRNLLGGLGYHMGDEPAPGSGGFRVKHLTKGNYVLTVSYDGKKISSMDVEVKGSKFQYFK